MDAESSMLPQFLDGKIRIFNGKRAFERNPYFTSVVYKARKCKVLLRQFLKKLKTNSSFCTLLF